MKAIMMKEFGSAEVFTLGSPQKPVPQEGQIGIRIKAASFNPVDFKIRAGWYPLDPHQILGCDCSGIIESLGPNTKGFSIGDEVYAMCGSFFHASNGGYAEYVCVPAELVYKKPKNLSFEEAAAVPLAAMTAYRATLASIPIKDTHTVFIAGIGGGVGSFAVQFLRIVGVKKIYTACKDKKSAEIIQKNQGVEAPSIAHYEGLSSGALKEKILQMNKGDFFDVTIDLVGGAMKELCLELTNYSGYFATIVPEKDFKSFDVWSEGAIPRSRNVSLLQVSIGAELGSNQRKHWQIYKHHMALITRWIEQGQLKPQVENIGTLSVETVQKAHTLLEGHHVKGKLVMTVD